MRMFFHHGLTADELFTNSPKRLTKKSWKWFIRKYGSTKSRWDALAHPFEYCLGLILHYVIDNRVRFKIPRVPDSYIDFEIVMGDLFEKQRQLGRFSKIDFVESDFTGYALKYYFKTKAYQRELPIYIGGELRDKFLSGINSGIKYYTTKDIEIGYFLPLVKEKFPQLTQLEIERIVLHGFRRMHSAIKYGCSITINVRKYINCVMHIGMITLDPKRQIKFFAQRMGKKLRKLEGWKRPEFDGYYYLTLSESKFEEWCQLNKTSRCIIKFRNIMAYRLAEELYYKNSHSYLFRFKVDKFHSWRFWKEELNLRQVDYLGEVVERRLVPSTKTWKQLIKEYEKGSG